MRIPRQRGLNATGHGRFVSLCSFHVDAMMDLPTRKIRLFFLLLIGGRTRSSIWFLNRPRPLAFGQLHLLIPPIRPLKLSSLIDLHDERVVLVGFTTNTIHACHSRLRCAPSVRGHLVRRSRMMRSRRGFCYSRIVTNPSMNRLPIEDVLSELQQALAQGSNALLTAPPGAGKTTRVPLALLDTPWLTGQKLLMLEPRRLAAVAAAHRRAATLNEPVGKTVGYRMRLDTNVGARTRLEVVTEGGLTRLLVSNPELKGYGAIVFDEFHERSLQADIGLALARETQRLIRPELRLLVMSATLHCGPGSALLGGAPRGFCA